jgi:hypothetical protein
MKLRLAGTLVLVLGIAALSSASAYAGNGNGNGNSKNDQPAATGAQADHGNADAPGQLKKDEATVAQTTSVAAAPAAAPVDQGGVKPANDTAHDTHAAASSAQTKLYGNGKNAGQIAIQNGAAPSTSIHGPGNSQPHKASPCAGGHEVDVHALKAKRGGSCGSSSPLPHTTPDPGKVPDPGRPSDPGKSSPDNAPAPRLGPSGVSVVSSRPVDPKVSPRSHAGGLGAGVRAATQFVGGGTLPFTGLDLWSTVFVAVALILIGLAMCRRARTVPARESDEGARP